MTDHETFVLLAAKQIGEPLSAGEEDDLEAHLATCPACRSVAAGMRRDDARLRAELGPTKVSPRVRRRVLDEAAGRRHIDPRLILGLAAALAVAAMGVPLLAGGRLVGDPSPAVTSPSAAVTSPSAPPASTRSPSPSPSVVSPSALAPRCLPLRRDPGRSWWGTTSTASPRRVEILWRHISMTGRRSASGREGGPRPAVGRSTAAP